MVLIAFALISGLSFLFYGFHTLMAERPKEEFDRYGIRSLRPFVGTTQLLGAAGVLLGLVIAPLGALAAAGLTLMMALGVIVRVILHDPLLAMLPATTLGVLNAALVALFLV